MTRADVPPAEVVLDLERPGGGAAQGVGSGRWLAVSVVLLTALNLRSVVAGLSPLLPLVSQDFTVTTRDVGVVGMLPAAAFAVFGFVGPRFARLRRLETCVVLALLTMVAGLLVRAWSTTFAVLAVGSAVTLAGIGVANVLLPPLVKTYFPSRVGLVTAAYVSAMGLGTFLPALIAVPVAEAVGWRTSLGLWALTTAVAVLPALVLRRSSARRRSRGCPVPAPSPARGRQRGHRRSRSTWALAGLFAVASVYVYTFFAWLPHFLVDRTGMSVEHAGRLLSLFAVTGLPGGVLLPLLASRLRGGTVPVVASGVAFAAGSLGLLLAPSAAPALWVGCAGLGTSLVPLTLTLVNLRSATAEESASLSGFVQGIGFAAGAAGPLVFGALHSLTGAWTAPLLVLTCSAGLAPLAAVWLRVPRADEREAPPDHVSMLTRPPSHP